MKLFNVITVQDFYVLAADHDDARAVADNVIKAGDQRPYDQVAYEVTDERKLREQWKSDTPWVSSNVDYNPEQPETCAELFARLYAKR